jgi:DNA-binding NarL/FixJ family response regulator
MGENVVMVMPQAMLQESEGGAGEDILTKRELEVLGLEARGKSNRQIARHLSLSESTVKRDLANIYPKMGVGSSGEAVRRALDNEWLTICDITAEAENQ